MEFLGAFGSQHMVWDAHGDGLYDLISVQAMIVIDDVEYLTRAV